MNADDVKTSHPDKVFYPDDGLAKGDVVDHYRAVADAMVPHLAGRPLTLRRFPEGIDHEGWFQKKASEHFPDWVRTEEVPQRGADEPIRHVVCDDAATLVYLANQGTVEFHVWPSTVDAADRPDRLVVDLDPADGTDTADLRAVARDLRTVFDHLGLTAFVQATGGRGFHVVAPLDATTPADEVLAFSRELADHVAASAPDTLTTAQRKDRRGDRIFLDVNRNGYAQTFVAPYSLRARPGAAVATPLDWRELGKAEPAHWHPDTIRRRLASKQDPWAGMAKAAASARTAAKRLDALH